jgi:DHA1 family tetracycline resistance protein-like MFS transporter
MLVYLSRVIDGFSGGNISTAQAYVSDVTTSENRAKSMGILGAAFGIGFSIGPALGGLLGHFDLSWPAFAAAIFSGVAAFLTYTRLVESRVHKPAETDVWLHPSKFRPIFQNSPLLQMLLIFFFSMMAFVMMESVFALFLKDNFHFNVGTVGLFFALAGVVIVVVQGGLIGRLIIGPLLVTGAMGLYFYAGLRPFLAVLICGTLFNATGRSLQTPALSSLISKTSDPKQQGAVFGLFHMLGSLARFIGPLIATAIYTVHHSGPFALAGAITFLIALWTVALRAQSATPRAAPVPAE